VLLDLRQTFQLIMEWTRQGYLIVAEGVTYLYVARINETDPGNFLTPLLAVFFNPYAI
jgi:hypothetical protein